MVDNHIFSKIEPEINKSIKLFDQSAISQKTTMESDHIKDKTRSLSEGKESKIGKKLTKSFLEKEKNFLKNPMDYEKIIEVNLNNKKINRKIIPLRNTKRK
jgi:hypothetical protein